MVDPSTHRGVIPGDAVHRADQPVLVDCGHGADESKGNPISVVPLIDGSTVVGFEVRCSCGAFVIVECIYGENP